MVSQSGSSPSLVNVSMIIKVECNHWQGLLFIALDTLCNHYTEADCPVEIQM